MTLALPELCSPVLHEQTLHGLSQAPFVTSKSPHAFQMRAQATLGWGVQLIHVSCTCHQLLPANGSVPFQHDDTNATW